MAGVPYNPLSGKKAPQNSTAGEPDLFQIFRQDLQGAPGRLYDQFIGQPLTALDVLGSAISTPNKIPVTEDEFIQQMIQSGEFDQAADILGGLVGTSGAGAASTMRPDENFLNVFAGVRAKTADRKLLNEALEASKNFKVQNKEKGIAGLTEQDINEIYQGTGWFPGVDQRWRFEIPDVVRPRAGLPNPDKQFENLAKEYPDAKNNLGFIWEEAKKLPEVNRLGTMEQFIGHPDLFDAYPEIASLKTRVTGKLGSPQEGVNNMGLDPETMAHIVAQGGTQEDIISVLMHEVQHEIQKIEGFANGGNPKQIGQFMASQVPSAAEQLLLPEPYDIYRALMGETEARQVQRRYELGTAMGADPRLSGVAPLVDKSEFAMDIPPQWQIHNKWIEDPTTFIGPEGYGSSRSLIDKLKAYASNLRDEEAQGFMKAASK
jgi:hypothetical protein